MCSSELSNYRGQVLLSRGTGNIPEGFSGVPFAGSEGMWRQSPASASFPGGRCNLGRGAGGRGKGGRGVELRLGTRAAGWAWA